MLTRSRIDTHGSSRAIAIRAVIRDALSIYAVDEQRLGAELFPDFAPTHAPVIVRLR